nr:cupin domain-containing protein [Acetoanaerobium pronyense]
MKGCENVKKLICGKDIEKAKSEGTKTIYIDKNTIVTPSAKDMAKAFGIELSSQCIPCEVKSAVKNPDGGKNELDSDMIYNLLKGLMSKGLLNEVLESLANPKPYTCETAGNGVKLVRGDSVKFDVFDTGNPNAKVSYQELISKEESSMSAGLLTIENSEFDWNLTYEELDYVIEGTLTVTIDGKTLTANKGDILYVPSGSNVTWGSPDKAKIFYVTYPANWADLL